MMSAVSSLRGRVQRAFRAPGRPPSSASLAVLCRSRRDLTPLAASLAVLVPGRRVEIVVADSPSGSPETVVWERSSSRFDRFSFDPELFGQPSAREVIERFVDFASAVLALDGVGPGLTAVAFGDDAPERGLGFCTDGTAASLIPDPIFLAEQGYRSLRDAYARRSHYCPRIPTALWRGASSGRFDVCGEPVVGWRDLPRVRLCDIAHRRGRGLIDAAVTEVLGLDGVASSELASREPGIMDVPMPPERFIDHAYQIDIDGNTSAWKGLFIKLLTGTPVLKVASPRGFRQWYYEGLVPWTNFVPVLADMSDLPEKVQWLRTNPEACDDIGTAGARLARSLTFERETMAMCPVIDAALRAGI